MKQQFQWNKAMKDQPALPYSTGWQECVHCRAGHRRAWVHFECCGWVPCPGCGTIVCRQHLAKRCQDTSCEKCGKPWVPRLHVAKKDCEPARVPTKARKTSKAPVLAGAKKDAMPATPKPPMTLARALKQYDEVKAMQEADDEEAAEAKRPAAAAGPDPVEDEYGFVTQRTKMKDATFTENRRNIYRLAYGHGECKCEVCKAKRVIALPYGP